MPFGAERPLPLFFIVQTPAASPSSRFSLTCNGKGRHYWQGFQRLSRLHGCLRFSCCPAPAPRFLGHKPTQRRGKERHSAGLSYARRIYMGASAFRYQSTIKYLASGWAKTIADTDASGSIMNSSVKWTPMSSGLMRLNSFAWSSRFGQAG